MDPLSITLSITALLKLTKDVILFIKEAKDASDERKKFVRETASLSGMLNTLVDFVNEEDKNDSWLYAISDLIARGGPFDQYCLALQLLKTKLTPTSGVRKLGQTIVWKHVKEDIHQLLLQIERLKTLVGIALDVDHIKLSCEIKSCLSDVANGVSKLQMSNTIIQDTTSAISDSTAVRDKKDLLDKICSVDYLQQHRDAIARHQDGTGNWFLRDPIYQTWTSSSRATLVCPGVPGAGKTIMAALVIEQQRRTVLSAQKPVVFIYYDYKRRDQQTLRHFLETILRQLVDAQSDLPEPVKALYENTPSTADIERTLYETVKHLEGMIIVTDALDECHDDTRQGVLTLVAKLQDHTEVRYMATTRDLHASISHAVFRKQPTLTIKAMRRDLEAYTRSRAQTLRVKIEPNLLEDLVIGVVAAADGMFLLARLLMDSFQTKLRVKTIKSDLQRLPRGLEAYDVAYEDAMRRIFDQGSECQETAKRILSLVLCAGRPLKTLEIQSALMIEPGDADLDQEDTLDPEDILSICAGLIKIDESSETIGFVHYTTQEYLERTQGLWLPRAEFEIARTCLDYLLAVPSVINSGTSQKTGLTFKSYAVQYGPFHWNAAMPNESSQHAALLSLLARPHILTAMWQKCAHRKLREGGGTFVHLIALLGLADLMKFCIDRGFDHDTKNTFGRTPLSYAAQEGHRQVVRLLLERGATIDSTDHDDRTPLMYAVTGKGHYDTHAFCLTLLTRERAVPSTIQANVRFDPTDMPSILPPSHAVPESESFTALRLVEPDLFVDIGNGNDQPQTVGTAAVSRQCQLFTRSPSGYGAILNSRSKSTVPVRSNSTRTGYGPVIKLLLERGALQAERQTFPCHFSAHLVGIVDILNNYAGIFGPYKGSGTTALRSTATDDRLAVVKSLLSKGANLNVTDKYGWGSLNYATIASNYDIVEILCGVGGVDVNITDVVGQTPLFYAELLQEILDKSRPYHNICEKLRPTWIGDLRFW